MNWICQSRMGLPSELEKHYAYQLQLRANLIHQSLGQRMTTNLTKTVWKSSARATTALFQSRMCRERTVANIRYLFATPVA